ncbi:MAG: HD-GYP domain-containing protein [Chromatiaceae bacterium]|nr:HD-GYP domain-containing protein [Chromatiaceae bacterium]
MIKKIAIDQLTPGMHVHDLNFGWMEHPYARNNFLLEDERTLRQIRQLGIRELYIDTSRGIDVPDAPSQAEVNDSLEREMEAIISAPAPPPCSLEEEHKEALVIHQEAVQVIRKLMEDARLGHQVDVERTTPLVGKMVDSIFRNRDALLGLTRIRRMDRYTFEHSVNVAVLMTAFARSLELDRRTIHEIGTGALLHDIGKTLVPNEILNKPGRLDEAEFSIMRAHVEHSRDILEQAPGIPGVALAVAAEHHERVDGSGYPQRLKGEGISHYGRMAAIVDVYDAITSDRVYHQGMEPHLALRKLLEWSHHHLDAKLVQQFIRCVGIYPVGSLVRLQSNCLAVVVGRGREGMREPRVRLVLDIAKRRYLKPRDIDLSVAVKGEKDRILSAESPEQWRIQTDAVLRQMP